VPGAAAFCHHVYTVLAASCCIIIPPYFGCFDACCHACCLLGSQPQVLACAGNVPTVACSWFASLHEQWGRLFTSLHVGREGGHIGSTSCAITYCLASLAGRVLCSAALLFRFLLLPQLSERTAPLYCCGLQQQVYRCILQQHMHDRGLQQHVLWVFAAQHRCWGLHLLYWLTYEPHSVHSCSPGPVCMWYSRLKLRVTLLFELLCMEWRARHLVGAAAGWSESDVRHTAV
jgi:hypothetical protein